MKKVKWIIERSHYGVFYKCECDFRFFKSDMCEIDMTKFKYCSGCGKEILPIY